MRSRRIFATLVATAAAALSLGAGAGAAQAASPVYGQMLHPFWSQMTDTTVNRELDLVQQSGGGLVRADLSWSSLQLNGPTGYDSGYLGRIDRFVNAAQSRNLQVIFSVMSSPCWASSAPDTLKQSCSGSWWGRGVQYWAPTNPANYATALSYLASRYKGRVLAYEVWNEPNSTDFWNAPSGQDATTAYVNLVKAAYPAVKAADPNAQVLAGSTMHADFNYVSALYDRGIKGFFDGISIHPYNEWRDPYDPWQAQYCQYTFKCGTETTHQVMVDHGDGDKPLWLTEFGWSTCNDFSYHSVCVTPDQQADYLKKAYEIIRGWSYVKTGVWFETHDEGTDPSVRNQNHGLVTYDYTPKPSFAAYQVASSSTSTPTPTTGTTTTPTTTKKKGGKTAGARVSLAVDYDSTTQVLHVRGSIAPAAKQGTVVVRAYRKRHGRWVLARSVGTRAKVRSARFDKRVRRRLARGGYRFQARYQPPVAKASASRSGLSRLVLKRI